MIILDILFNVLIFILTFGAWGTCFRKDGEWAAEQGVGALRYFTLLSNLLCALASLAAAVCVCRGSVPHVLWMLKYIGTAAVTVTLMTVMLYLGPAFGYKALLSGRDMLLHLICPVLAVVSFCFLERFYPLSFAAAMTGILPVALYGALYLYKVVVCPEEKRWEDFYGFNKGGKWPLSFAAMAVGGLLVCLILWLLYGI